jgi:hypothetical protein
MKLRCCAEAGTTLARARTPGRSAARPAHCHIVAAMIETIMKSMPRTSMSPLPEKAQKPRTGRASFSW